MDSLHERDRKILLEYRMMQQHLAAQAPAAEDDSNPVQHAEPPAEEEDAQIAMLPAAPLSVEQKLAQLMEENATIKKQLAETRKDVDALVALEEVNAVDDRVDKMEKDNNDKRAMHLNMIDTLGGQVCDMGAWLVDHKLSVVNAMSAIHDAVYYLMKYIPDQTANPTHTLKRVHESTTILQQQRPLKRPRPLSIPGRVTMALQRRNLAAAQDIQAGTFLGHVNMPQ